MYVAAIHRPQITPLTDFTKFITNTSEYTDNCRTVFASDLNIEVLSDSNTLRNYGDTFRQYGLTNEKNLPTFVSPSTDIDTSLIDHL